MSILHACRSDKINGVTFTALHFPDYRVPFEAGLWPKINVWFFLVMLLRASYTPPTVSEGEDLPHRVEQLLEKCCPLSDGNLEFAAVPQTESPISAASS